MQFKSIFSFYGGKSKLAHLYPKPRGEWIVEPFAGGASYSAHYAEKNVQLYDCDPAVAAIWEFLLQKDWAATLQYARELVPPTIDAGIKVSRMLADKLHWAEGQELTVMEMGLLRLLQAEANCGTQGAKGIHDQVTWMAAKQWDRILPRLEYWLPRINHWKFIQGDYTEAPNMKATWFVDPPYNNAAGKRYRQQVPDYEALAQWCTSRKGDVIICENEGATWPGNSFTMRALKPRLGVSGRYQKSRALEVMFTKQARISNQFFPETLAESINRYASQYISVSEPQQWGQFSTARRNEMYDNYLRTATFATQQFRWTVEPRLTAPAPDATNSEPLPNPNPTTNEGSTNGSS